MAGKGQPKTGGRKLGSLNKATAAVKELAGKHTEEAIKTLAEIMTSEKEPGKTRAAAANALLDRAHGRPAQSHTLGDEEGNTGLTVIIHRDGNTPSQ